MERRWDGTTRLVGNIRRITFLQGVMGSMRIENGLLKRAWESPDGRHVTMQVVVPATRIKEVLWEMHNGNSGAHFGIKKTLSKIRDKFYWIRCREDVESWCKKCRTCAAVKRPKTEARGPMQPQNVGLPFGRTVGEVAGPLSVPKERNKDTKKVESHDDGLQEKLPSVYEMLHHQNRAATGRMKTRYDFWNNSVGFQAGYLAWVYNPRRRNGCCRKLSSGWEGPYIIVTRINDAVYRVRRGPKRNRKLVHLGRLMKYDSSGVDVSDRDDQN